MALEPPQRSEPVSPWRDITALFGLSPPLTRPTPIPGGWSHSVWHVETVQGSFAIKEIVNNPQRWWAEQLSEAIDFEVRAWQSGEIPMAEPIRVVGSTDLLGTLGIDRRYRCHRWVEGEPCSDQPPSTRRSAHVGTIVAALARLNVRRGTTEDQLAWNALDAYDETVAEADSTGAGWAPTLAALEPHVAELRRESVDLAGRALPMMVMHRDIDPKNAATRPDGAVALFDWDYAGPRLIACELLDAALSFAGPSADADEGCVLSTVDAYNENGGPTLDFSDAAAPLAEEGFRWIMLNAWRALGHRGVSGDERDFAAAVVQDLAPTWPTSVAAERGWAQHLAASP